VLEVVASSGNHNAGGKTEKFRVEVSGMGDPGHAATAAMLSENALCLAMDLLMQARPLFVPLPSCNALKAAMHSKLGPVGNLCS
jgi:hypothetical protein